MNNGNKSTGMIYSERSGSEKLYRIIYGENYPESVLWMIRQNCFVSAALRENMDLEMLYAVTFIRPEE